MDVVSGVDLSVSNRNRIQPADDVVIIGRAFFQQAELLFECVCWPGVNLQQARINLFHLQRN